MNEKLAREEICSVGRSLFDRGYAHATAGNISVRLDDGFLITPTDACLGALDPALIARVDARGTQVGGALASKTLALHRAIYQAHKGSVIEPRCVIHTHSTHCVAVSMHVDGPYLLPPITPYFVMKVGRVPLVPYHRPGDVRVAGIVAELIERHIERGTPIRSVMLARLGPNVWHASPTHAMAVLEELEETARLWWMANPKPEPLDGDAIAALREAFGACW